MEIKKIILFLSIMLIFNACNALQGKKRSETSDEFLIEKKNPLVVPPDFDELPLPKDQNQTPEKNEQTDIKSLISNNENSSSETINNTNQNTSFENSLLEKIKKN